MGYCSMASVGSIKSARSHSSSQKAHGRLSQVSHQSRPSSAEVPAETPQVDASRPVLQKADSAHMRSKARAKACAIVIDQEFLSETVQQTPPAALPSSQPPRSNF